MEMHWVGLLSAWYKSEVFYLGDLKIDQKYIQSLIDLHISGSK